MPLEIAVIYTFYAFVVIVLIGASIRWIIREGEENDRQKRAALADRFCVTCGYNVHACGSDRCPECGTPIVPPEGLPRPRNPL